MQKLTFQVELHFDGTAPSIEDVSAAIVHALTEQSEHRGFADEDKVGEGEEIGAAAGVILFYPESQHFEFQGFYSPGSEPDIQFNAEVDQFLAQHKLGSFAESKLQQPVIISVLHGVCTVCGREYDDLHNAQCLLDDCPSNQSDFVPLLTGLQTPESQQQFQKLLDRRNNADYQCFMFLRDQLRNIVETLYGYATASRIDPDAVANLLNEVHDNKLLEQMQELINDRESVNDEMMRLLAGQS